VISAAIRLRGATSKASRSYEKSVSEEHLRRTLWTGLGFRARDFWKSARRRELPVGEFFDDVVADDSTEHVEDAAVTAADTRCIDDCLSELDPRERAVYRLVKATNSDVLARPIDDDDARRVEDRITCLGECQSIADDYIALAIELGVPPMPDAWW
jgi:hypothetical protein